MGFIIISFTVNMTEILTFQNNDRLTATNDQTMSTPLGHASPISLGHCPSYNKSIYIAN